MNEVMLPQAMAQANAMQEASYRLLKKALNAEAASMAQLLEALPAAAPLRVPNSAVGNNLDLYA